MNNNDGEESEVGIADMMAGLTFVAIFILIFAHIAVWSWAYFPWVSHKIQKYYSEESK